MTGSITDLRRCFKEAGTIFIPVVRLHDVSNQPNVRPYPG
jgi:hypothetical protein